MDSCDGLPARDRLLWDRLVAWVADLVGICSDFAGPVWQWFGGQADFRMVPESEGSCGCD